MGTKVSARNYFTAKYRAPCYNCRQLIEIGDKAFYTPGHDHVIGELCCGEYTDTELLPLVESLDYEHGDAHDSVRLKALMPRGKHASDKCMKCFQIPASNGVCGCHG